MNATTLAAAPAPPFTAEGGAPRTPRPAAVLRTHVRTVGWALRRELLVLAAVLAVLLVLIVGYFAQQPGRTTDMQFPEFMLMTVVLSLFAPMAVWKGESPSRRAYLWCLPVPRAPNTLARVLAGWAWLMLALALYVAWAALLARLTGGTLSLGPTQLSPTPGVPADTLPPDQLFRHPWPVPAWMWILPFVTGTVAYLLASAVVLATDHPWRWIAALAVAVMLAMATPVAAVQNAVWSVVAAPHGLEVLAAGGNPRPVSVPTPAGGEIQTYAFVPDPEGWRVAALLWVGLGLAAFLVAAFRRQER